MMKTEAAQILATKTRVMSRVWGMEIGKDLVEAVLSEARHWDGLFPAAAEAAPSWKTVLRLANN